MLRVCQEVPYRDETSSQKVIDGGESMVQFATPELYKKFRDQVLEYSNAVQGDKPRGLSDTEIAEKLGLSEDDVREIRCIAEADLPLDRWSEAEEFKEKACRRYFKTDRSET